MCIDTHPKFLTDIQREVVRKKVNYSSGLYQPVNKRVPFRDFDTVCAHTLGSAIYTDRPINDMFICQMELIFRDLYKKTVKYISKIVGTDEVALANFTVPGFHIYKGEVLNDEFKKLPYHLDHDLFLNGKVDTTYLDPDSVISFVSLIENTEDPAYLEYMDGDTPKKFYYEYGNLYTWRGYLPHRIGNSKFKGDEKRITFQGHVVKMLDSDLHLLYF